PPFGGFLHRYRPYRPNELSTVVAHYPHFSSSRRIYHHTNQMEVEYTSHRRNSFAMKRQRGRAV
ncbi:hypothetical protein ACHAXM_003854, partial [Skeletonema potamos]